MLSYAVVASLLTAAAALPFNTTDTELVERQGISATKYWAYFSGSSFGTLPPQDGAPTVCPTAFFQSTS
jgi:hypothetical protein